MAVRDARLAAAVGALNGRGSVAGEPELAPQKLLVSAGTVAVLSFGMFHRGTRRGLAAPPRSMFKFQVSWLLRTASRCLTMPQLPPPPRVPPRVLCTLSLSRAWLIPPPRHRNGPQFLRTQAPSPKRPSWAHTPGIPFPHSRTADGSPLSPARAAVCHGVWDWLTAGEVQPPTDQVAAVGSGFGPVDAQEVCRVGAAYQLAAAAGAAWAAGSESAAATAVETLLAGLKQREALRRAACYGLAAAGDVSVTPLAMALPALANGPAFAAAAHALGEAPRTAAAAERAAPPLLDALSTLRHQLAESAAYRSDCRSAVHSWNTLSWVVAYSTGGATASSTGLDVPASRLRFNLAAVATALGCIGERVDPEGLCAAAVADALLPLTLLAEEPGGHPGPDGARLPQTVSRSTEADLLALPACPPGPDHHLLRAAHWIPPDSLLMCRHSNAGRGPSLGTRVSGPWTASAQFWRGSFHIIRRLPRHPAHYPCLSLR